MLVGIIIGVTIVVIIMSLIYIIESIFQLELKLNNMDSSINRIFNKLISESIECERIKNKLNNIDGNYTEGGWSVSNTAYLTDTFKRKKDKK